MSTPAKFLIGVTEVDPAGRIRQMNYVRLDGNKLDMGTGVIDGLPGTQADGIPDVQCPAAGETCVGQPVTEESKKFFDTAKSSLEANLKLFDDRGATVCKLLEQDGNLVECRRGDVAITLSDDTGDGKPDHAAIYISSPTTTIIVFDCPIALIKGADELYNKGKGIPAAK